MPSILLIGDNTEISRLTSRILTKKGFDVNIVTDNNVVPDKNTDLIIFDINTEISPEFGFSLYDNIIKTCSRAKIIWMSSNEKDEIRALEAGADDWIRKPFHMDVFIARIKRLCRKKIII